MGALRIDPRWPQVGVGDSLHIRFSPLPEGNGDQKCLIQSVLLNVSQAAPPLELHATTKSASVSGSFDRLRTVRTTASRVDEPGGGGRAMLPGRRGRRVKWRFNVAHLIHERVGTSEAKAA
jgi:hypothetical protein